MGTTIVRTPSQGRTRLRDAGVSGRVLHLVDGLFERPSLTIGGAAEHLLVTPRAARMMIEKLEAKGIVREVTGKQRGRVYVASDLLAILDAG